MSLELIEDEDIYVAETVVETAKVEDVVDKKEAPAAEVEDVETKVASTAEVDILSQGIDDLDLDNIEPSADRARDAKERGNKFFAKGKYDDALECYAECLLFAPDEDKEDRALYHNNKAAAHFMLEQWEDVTYETTQAIHLKQRFTKAFVRRARAYEKLDKLSEALDDYKIVAHLEPNDKQYPLKVEELNKKVQERFETQKTEMLDKLKGFGNTILGKFGMNLDQFNAVKDPATGSYSLSFGQQPSAQQPPE